MPSIYDIPFWSNRFYDHKARWLHYYNQVREVARQIRARKGDIENFRVLEVGPSHGFVADYLKKFGTNVTTIDNKKEYKPDVLGTVLDMPFKPNTFDMVIICEVLEHMPYRDFPTALKELHRVTRGSVLLSVPDVRRIVFSLDLKLPFLKPIRALVRIPTFKTHVCPVPGGHQWEIGKKGYSLGVIRKTIKDAGFSIKDDKVFIDTPKNHYFILKK